MSTEIAFSGRAASPPASVSEIISILESARHRLRAAVDEAGGLKRNDMRESIGATMRDAGVTGGSEARFETPMIDFTSRSRKLAVSLQAGRAEVNNGALVSVLAAASDPGIDWLIIVLPERYKQGRTYTNVAEQLISLSHASGIDLELDGVILVPF